jgi:hypothetical protein
MKRKMENVVMRSSCNLFTYNFVKWTWEVGPMIMKKKIILLSLIISGLFICGCFEYEDVMTIRKDGSGTLAVHYSTYKDSNVKQIYFKKVTDRGVQ